MCTKLHAMIAPLLMNYKEKKRIKKNTSHVTVVSQNFSGGRVAKLCLHESYAV